VTIRAPAYQVLADDLRTQITSGQLRPGERLPTEPELCARSGVSRSTVREALRLLASQHLIVTTRGVTGGSYVAQPSPATLAASLTPGLSLLLSTTTVGLTDLMEVREMLEVPAVGLAARRRTDADLAALAQALYDPADGMPAKAAAHKAFHEALAAATGNPFYELMVRPLYAVGNAIEIGVRATAEFWHSIDVEHRAILQALVARDQRAAEQAARLHLDSLRANWPDV
jgi:GntR family transcriptional repressor for pyruvate dehydrogenase complex